MHLICGCAILGIMMLIACAEIGTNGKLSAWLGRWMPRWIQDPLSAVLTVLLAAGLSCMIIGCACELVAEVNGQQTCICNEDGCSARSMSSESDDTLFLTE